VITGNIGIITSQYGEFYMEQYLAWWDAMKTIDRGLKL